MGFVSPMPADQLWNDYNQRYFDNAHGGHQASRVALAFFSALAKLRCDHVVRYFENSGMGLPGAILEIGPGSGAFAAQWLKMKPQTDYWAVESDASCHDALRALGVRLAESPASLPEGHSVGLVVMSHVLEHTTRPAEALCSVADRLSPGGVLFVEVPCRDFEHKPLDEPHVQFFDKAPMRRLLERLAFTDIQLTYHGQRIDTLKPGHLWERAARVLRHQLLTMGFSAPFSVMEPGLEPITDSFERAVVKPFLAHLEQPVPSWWLRAVAVKGRD